MGFVDGDLSSPPSASAWACWQHIMSGCGQRAKTLAFLWLCLFKLPRRKRTLFNTVTDELLSSPHSLPPPILTRPASLQLRLLIFEVPVIYSCCSSTTVSLRGNSSCYTVCQYIYLQSRGHAELEKQMPARLFALCLSRR